MRNELRRIWKEEVVAWFVALFGICQEELVGIVEIKDDI
jgi:hypothetical protein